MSSAPQSLHQASNHLLLLLLLLPLILLPGFAYGGVENIDSSEYLDDVDEPSEDVKNLLNNTKTDLLNCCEKTRTEVKTSVQELSENIKPKLNNLANKTDIEGLKGELSELATKSALDQLTDKVDALPTKDTLNNYTQYIKQEFTALVDHLENNITELDEKTRNHLSNNITELSYMLGEIKDFNIPDLKDKMKNNNDQMVIKLESTHDNIKNLTVLVGKLATKVGINETQNKLSMSISEVQTSVDEISQNLTHLVNKNDIEDIKVLFESLATKDSLEFLQDLKNLSKEDTVKNLTNFVTTQIANKEDVQDTKAKITTSTSEIKKEISVLKEKLSNLALTVDVQNLNKKVLGIDDKVETSKEHVSDLKDMVQKLLNKQEEQSNKLKELIVNVAKTSTSEELTKVEQLIRSLQSTSNNTLVAVKGIRNTNYSPTLEPDQSHNNCLESSLFTEQIDSLKRKVDDKCSTDNIKEDLKGMEEHLQTSIENITLPEKPCTSLATEAPKGAPAAASCEDSEFLNTPGDINVCNVVVKHGYCKADYLFGFHCCTSCVFAKQISSDGPHLYVNAPRKINYSEVIEHFISEAKIKNIF